MLFRSRRAVGVSRQAEVVDAAVTVLGMVAGAAAAHNFGLAGNPDSAADGVYQVGGIGTAGMIAVVIGFAVLLAVSLLHLPGKEEA